MGTPLMHLIPEAGKSQNEGSSFCDVVPIKNNISGQRQILKQKYGSLKNGSEGEQNRATFRDLDHTF